MNCSPSESRPSRERRRLSTYRSWNRAHLEPFFGTATVDRIDRRLIEASDAELARKGLAPKSRRNSLSVLHSIFDFAVREGWASTNPTKEVEQPKVGGADPDIRFLDVEEVEALLRAVPDDDLGHVEQALYLTAMTGMRQGELLALRWMDIDWIAGRVRVRRNFVRGEFGTPKSKSSSRSVPLAARVAGELERSARQRSGDRISGEDSRVQNLFEDRCGRRLVHAPSRVRERFLVFGVDDPGRWPIGHTREV